MYVTLQADNAIMPPTTLLQRVERLNHNPLSLELNPLIFACW